MLKALIIDDEKVNCYSLKKMIDNYCESVEVVGICHTVDDGEKLIEDKEPNVIFLDIKLEGETGFELLNRYETPNFLVIFTTAHADYAIRALKVAAFDFLLKPVSIVELRKSITRAEEYLLGNKPRFNYREGLSIVKSANESPSGYLSEKIAIASSEGIEYIRMDDILHCEADRAYCTFYLKEGRKIIASKSLGEFEPVLLANNFFRTHRSHLVNLIHVVRFVKSDGGSVVLTDGTHVPVAQRRKEELMIVLNA